MRKKNRVKITISNNCSHEKNPVGGQVSANFGFKNTAKSILTGLIVAGLFTFVLYAFATPPTSKYAPGATLTPSCAPGDTNCSVEAPLANNFTAAFSGTGAFTTTGIGTFGTLAVSSGSITDSSGAISFGNENLITTGTLGAGAITGTSFTDSTATLSGGNLTGMGNITGTDVDISAGTGDFSTTGTLGTGTHTIGAATGVTLSGAAEVLHLQV